MNSFLLLSMKHNAVNSEIECYIIVVRNFEEQVLYVYL